MEWKLARAKQCFSEVIRRANDEPQIILNRENPVAAVISASELAAFAAWKRAQKKRSIVERLADAQRICREEGYEFEAPLREDRANPLIEERRRAPRRYQRA
jgi:prevent-host-death family protein